MRQAPVLRLVPSLIFWLLDRANDWLLDLSGLPEVECHVLFSCPPLVTSTSNSQGTSLCSPARLELSSSEGLVWILTLRGPWMKQGGMLVRKCHTKDEAHRVLPSWIAIILSSGDWTSDCCVTYSFRFFCWWGRL